jgi:condensin complex subunit 2
VQKINQKNTWDLDLIDHLTDIIRADDDNNDAETNFQMVSWFYGLRFP